MAHSESIPIKKEQKDSSSSSDSESSSGEENTKEEVKTEVKINEKMEVQEERNMEVKEEPPAVETLDGGDQSAPAVGVPASSADSGREVGPVKRKWTRRPPCPDNRCRQCWYVECGTPGGPKHTYDDKCNFVKGARGA